MESLNNINIQIERLNELIAMTNQAILRHSSVEKPSISSIAQYKDLNKKYAKELKELKRQYTRSLMAFIKPLGIENELKEELGFRQRYKHRISNRGKYSNFEHFETGNYGSNSFTISNNSSKIKKDKNIIIGYKDIEE